MQERHYEKKKNSKLDMHKEGENNSTSDMHAVRVKKQFNIKHAYIKRKKGSKSDVH